MKRLISIFLIFGIVLFFHETTTAQKYGQKHIDALLKELAKSRQDTNKVNILYELSTGYFYSNTSKGIKYGEEGVALAKQLGWTKGLAKLYNTLGNCSSYGQSYQNALLYYQKSLKAAEDIGEKSQQAIALKNIGNIYSYKTKDFPKAIDYYLKCLALLKQIGSEQELSEILSEIGTVYYLRADYSKAIDYFQQAMAKGELAGDKISVAENLSNISSVYQRQAKYPEALDYAEKAQKFLEAAGDKKGVAAILWKQGNIYNIKRDYQSALNKFSAALKIAEAKGNKSLIADNLQSIGDVQISQGKYLPALSSFLSALKLKENTNDRGGIGSNLSYVGKCYQALAENKEGEKLPDSLANLSEEVMLQRANYYLSKSIDFLKETGDFEQLQDTYEHLSQVQLKQGDKTGSRESYKQHNAYLESMYNQEKGDAIARKDMQYVFEKKQETLKQESEQKEVALNKEMQLNSLRYEYEKKKAAAKSEHERQQLIYEEQLKQEQISYEYERKQAQMEAAAALAKATLENQNALAEIRLKEARQQRWYLIIGIVLLLLMSGTIYSRFTNEKKNKRKLEEKNKQIAAEKENADRLRVRAENSEKFKQMFLANMSHEIRTPMNAVSGMTAILIEKGPRNDQVSYLQAISKSSDVLLHIINDILDLSKIEAGKMDLEEIEFSMKDTVTQVKDTLAHRADEKGLQLIANVHDSVFDVVVGDPFRLNQVLINLGGNAIKFTERGSVQIEVTAEEDKDEKITVRFSIIDTGIGIPKDKIKNLFGDFSQVNSSDTRKYGGTGLGLSISKQLVELHGGTILVESEEGSGTTFYFSVTYPKGSPEKLAQRIQQEKRADGSILNGMSILLADDNEYNRIVVYETLMLKADVEIDSVINGEEAVQAMKKKNYDVVLMDVQMPVMNGIEATIAIRKLAAPNKDVPIIALTASTLRADIDKCIKSGMTSYVPKPFKAWQLINTLAEVTGRKKQGEPMPQTPEKKDKPKVAKSVAAGGSEEMVTDPDYLHNFCEGDEARIQKYIRMYLKGVPDFVEKLNGAIATKDFKEIALRIHAFKPNWLIMGMKGTGELGSKIEHLCAEKNESAFESSKDLLAQIEKSVKELGNGKA